MPGLKEYVDEVLKTRRDRGIKIPVAVGAVCQLHGLDSEMRHSIFSELGHRGAAKRAAMLRAKK